MILAGRFSGPVDQYVSFDVLMVPGIRNECGRGGVAAVTVPGVVIGDGSCAWTGAVETAAEARSLARICSGVQHCDQVEQGGLCLTLWLVKYETHSGSDIFKSNGGQFRRQLHPNDHRVFRRRMFG